MARPSETNVEDTHTDPAIPSTVSSNDRSEHDVEKQAAVADFETEKQQHALTPVKSSAPSEFEYPSMKKALVILIALYAAVFIVAIDRTILGTAIPRMTDEFHSFNDIGWYQSACQ